MKIINLPTPQLVTASSIPFGTTFLADKNGALSSQRRLYLMLSNLIVDLEDPRLSVPLNINEQTIIHNYEPVDIEVKIVRQD